MGTAEDRAVLLDAVADHAASAMGTRWRQHVNRTFEAVERVFFAVGLNRERLVIFVAAHFAGTHDPSSNENPSELSAKEVPASFVESLVAVGSVP